MVVYDLIIVGSGAGGIAAAKLAAHLGARVALIEQSPEALGGAHLLRSDIPSKTFVHASRLHGNWTDVKLHIEKLLRKTLAEKALDESLRGQGIDLYFGKATFTSPKTVRIGKETVAGRRAVVATGATPRVPNIPGLKQAGFLTVGTLFSLARLPQTLTIIGGGMAAIEMAFALQRLGSRVTVIEHGSHILSHLDTEVSDYLKHQLQSLGVTVHTSTSILGITKTSRGYKLKCRHLGSPLTVRAGQLLVASGKDVNMPGGLSKARVRSTKSGILVNSHWQTSNKAIYAVGDVVEDAACLTPHAVAAAKQAVKHALLGTRSRPTYQPQVVFSDPPVAHVGATATQLLREGIEHQVFTLALQDIDYGRVIGAEGFIRIICEPDGRVIGGTLIGEGAGELVGYLALAINKNWPLSRLGDLPLAYPTLSVGLAQVATEAGHHSMPPAAKKIFTLRRLTRR